MRVFDKLRLTFGDVSSGKKASFGAASIGLFAESGSEADIVRVLQNAGTPSGSGSASRYVTLSLSKGDISSIFGTGLRPGRVAKLRLTGRAASRRC